MCGIAAALGFVDAEIAEALLRVSEAQAHRGPDDAGFWQGEGVALAHRRLSILDLSMDGHQPMHDPEAGISLVYNGEVYNYQALRSELEAAGVRFKSKTDTEVVLRAYGQWGESCVERFRGMFAFALWDAPRQRLLLARDRLGIKPLYHALVDRGPGRRTLLVASELRALLASGLVAPRIDPTALDTFVWHGFVRGSQSIIRDVHLLPPGSLASVDPGKPRVHATSYWTLPGSGARDNSISTLEHELESAVEMRLISDVPLGIFLSGGVDSSAVAALARRTAGSSIRTFSVGFEEAAYDESRYAEAVARSLGTDHTAILLTQQRFLDQLEQALYSIDQPTYDQLNTYVVSRAVREAGITVALAGVGGDELFGGYATFRDLPRAVRGSRALAWLPEGVANHLARRFARSKIGGDGEIPPQVRWGKLADVLATRGDIVRGYQVHYALFTRSFHRELLAASEQSVADHGLAKSDLVRLQRLVRDQPLLDATSVLELESFVGDRLLRDCDAASMAVSLELRVPLIDHRVVEAAAAVETRRRYARVGSKQLLRDLALRDLDPSIFDRPKAGFVLPIATWLEQELEGEVGATLKDADLCAAVGLSPEVVARLWRAFRSGSPGIHWSRVWSIFVLLWWCRRHGVVLQ